MIDPSMTDMLLESPDAISLPMAVDKIAARDIRIAELQQQLEQKTRDHSYVVERVQSLTAQINSFENELKNNPWDFDFDTLADLASYFGITLEKEYDVTITVRFSGTVSAPMDYDMDDIENILDISLDTGYGGAALTVDVYQDDFEIDYNEVM